MQTMLNATAARSVLSVDCLVNLLLPRLGPRLSPKSSALPTGAAFPETRGGRLQNWSHWSISIESVYDILSHISTERVSKLQARKASERRSPRSAGEVDAQVLGEITHTNRPVKAYEIVRKSSVEGNPLLPVQVYRSLDRLRSDGKIERVATLNAFVRSETRQPVHLICTDCGSAIAAEASEAHNLLDALCSSVGFSPREPHLEISGHCGQCEEAE